MFLHGWLCRLLRLRGPGEHLFDWCCAAPPRMAVNSDPVGWLCSALGSRRKLGPRAAFGIACSQARWPTPIAASMVKSGSQGYSLGLWLHGFSLPEVQGWE